MGGIGSGPQGGGRALTSTAIRLDLRREPFRSAVAGGGTFIARWSRGRELVGAVIVETTGLTDEGKPAALVVPLRLHSAPTWPVVGPTASLHLAWVPCRFGGHRAFVRCPHCSRQAVVLYLARGSWLCRRCAGVVHPSTRESDFDRALAKLAKTRRAMGYETWQASGWDIPSAPGRRMRAETWLRLSAQARADQLALWRAYERWLDVYMRTLARVLPAAFLAD